MSQIGNRMSHVGDINTDSLHLTLSNYNVNQQRKDKLCIFSDLFIVTFYVPSNLGVIRLRINIVVIIIIATY